MNRSLTYACLSLLIGLVFWTGCPGPKTTSIAVDAVSLEPIDGDRFREAIAHHRGNVVLVDFWATWCGPCRRSFPHTVQLHHDLANQGLSVISVSLDDSSDTEKVREFLAKKGASFENFISEYGAGMESFTEFDIPGGIPFFQIWDREGTLVKTFLGEPEDLEMVLGIYLEKT